MTTTVVHQSQPHMVIMPAAQTVQYHHATGPLPSENLNVARAAASGWIQIVCAVLSTILGIVAIIIEACKYASGTPIWCSLMFYLPAGILGVIAAKQKSSCSIIGCMVMSILSAIFSVSHFGVNLSGALNEDDYWYCGYDGYYDNWYDSYDDDEDDAGKIAVNSILTIIAVVEFIVAIYASSVMCGGTNCCRGRTNTTVTVVSSQQPTTATTTQVIQTGYPNVGVPGYTQPPPMQYGQQPAYPYQPHPGNYPAAPVNYPPPGNYAPPPGNYPTSGVNYPPPSYAASPEGKM